MKKNPKKTVPARFFLSFPIMKLILLSSLILFALGPTLIWPARVASQTDSSPGESLIAQIRDRGKLIAGVTYDFPPFGFVDDADQVVGFEVDLIKALAEEWGVAVEFAQVTPANRIAKLAAGEIDLVAASMTHLREWDAGIDFSLTYFAGEQGLLVGRESDIETWQDLDSKVVAAVQGAAALSQIERYAEENDLEIEVLPFAEFPQAVSALAAGQVDALTAVQVALAQAAQTNPTLTTLDESFTQEAFGLGIPEDQPYFYNLVNDTLHRLQENGTYAQIYRRWFGIVAQPYALESVPGEWPFTLADTPISAANGAPATSRTTSIIDRMLTDRTLTVAIENGSAVGDLAQSGFEIDLVQEFARRWLGDESTVGFVFVGPESGLQKVADGTVDLAVTSAVYQSDTAEIVSFSLPFLPVNSDRPVSRAGLPPYDSQFRDLVNFTLQEMVQDQTYDAIYCQWFGTSSTHQLEIWPGQSYLTVNSARVDSSPILAGQTCEPPQAEAHSSDVAPDEAVSSNIAPDDEVDNQPADDTPPADEPASAETTPVGTALLPQSDETPTLTQTETITPTAAVPPVNITLSETLTQTSSTTGTQTTAPTPELTFPFTYTVVEGDSLSLLAERFYGDLLAFEQIHAANLEIIGEDPNLIEVDMVLTIPAPPE